MDDGGTWGNKKLMSDYIRRSIMMNLPYAVISGYGVCLVCKYFQRNMLLRRIVLGGLIFYIFFILITRFQFYFPKRIFYDARRDKQIEKYTRFMQNYHSYWSAVERIPDNCLVITYNNLLVLDSFFEYKNLTSFQIGRIQPDTLKFIEPEMKKAECIIYLEDHFCRNEMPIPWQPSEFPCSYIKNNFNLNFLFSEREVNVYKAEWKVFGEDGTTEMTF